MIISMKAQELRRLFFEFFEKKGHNIIPSAPMVIKNDPTLMFINAGMNQFKDIFLGNLQPDNLRIANSQKCLRVSGKHNDLEEVGHDTYHHTMFEMLGNWSFGDYFKGEAINWAWEFLVKELNIPEDRLYATIYEGDNKDNVPRDNESFRYWEKCFSYPVEKILEGSKKDNFWEMGETGPCGPCSEVHIDLRDDEEREKIPGRKLVNKGHPHVIEIWNLVFIQYNRRSDGILEQLPLKHVDTGMGFERLCMVVQGKKSNYDIDIFQAIIKELSKITGKPYGVNEKWDIALRVVADHLRAISFSIADGQLPSNNKAGYVIRRILRRAVRYGYNTLGIEEPFIYKLVPVLVNTMGNQYPEIQGSKELISKTIFEEESAFLRTLGKGLKMIDTMINDLIKEQKDTLPGNIAFEMYDTFGFPVDLTQLILKENGILLDYKGFEEEMKKQKRRSREDAIVEAADWINVREIDGTEFTGYEKTEDEILITKYRTVKIKGKVNYQIIFNKTPFYAEAGGQAGDSGYIANENEKIKIFNTVKENNLHIHLTSQNISNAEKGFTAQVDSQKRHYTTYNHSATHLLHYALREVLGSQVEQKGSLVNHEKLRFDFNHFQKLSKEQIRRIETTVNQLIREDLLSYIIENLPMDEALEKGAIALFGEKYGENVRLVSFGDSIELCGGTHVKSTGNIGLFKIISEGAIASGTRRLEAVTSSTAFEYLDNKLNIIENIAEVLGVSDNIPEAVIKLAQENASLRKRIEKLDDEAAIVIKSKLLEKGEIINDIRIATGRLKDASVSMLKSIASKVRESGQSVILIIGSEQFGKANLVVMVSDDLIKTKNLNATTIIKEIAGEINGGGGGQPFLATAGGKNPAGLEKALKKSRDIIAKL
jgi:alanyl-tRNA synthetase